MKKTFFVLAAVVLFACTPKVAYVLSQTDVDRGSKSFPGLTLDELTSGKTAFEQNCVKCHDLKNPKSLNEEGWRKIVPKMAKKAGIDATTQDHILKYVVTMSTAK